MEENVLTHESLIIPNDDNANEITTKKTREKTNMVPLNKMEIAQSGVCNFNFKSRYVSMNSFGEEMFHPDSIKETLLTLK